MSIERPVIILGAPRSGTTLLFSILSSHPNLWSLYVEGETIFEAYFHPEKTGWHRGHQLGADDASDEIIRDLREQFYRRSLNYQVIFRNRYTKIYTNSFLEKINRKLYGLFVSPIVKPKSIRIVEKNPKNCLRIPFMNVLFPDSFFIFITRDPRTNISSLIDGWRQKGKYELYPLPTELQIEGYSGTCWHFLLPPMWEEYSQGKRLAEVCAFQYRVVNEVAMTDLSKIPKERKMILRYEDLVTQPEIEVQRVCDKIGLSYTGAAKRMAKEMPPVNTSSRPGSDKWKRNEMEVMSILRDVRCVAKQMGYDV